MSQIFNQMKMQKSNMVHSFKDSYYSLMLVEMLKFKIKGSQIPL